VGTRIVLRGGGGYVAKQWTVVVVGVVGSEGGVAGGRRGWPVASYLLY